MRRRSSTTVVAALSHEFAPRGISTAALIRSSFLLGPKRAGAGRGSGKRSPQKPKQAVRGKTAIARKIPAVAQPPHEEAADHHMEGVEDLAAAVGTSAKVEQTPLPSRAVEPEEEAGNSSKVFQEARVKVNEQGLLDSMALRGEESDDITKFTAAGALDAENSVVADSASYDRKEEEDTRVNLLAKRRRSTQVGRVLQQRLLERGHEAFLLDVAYRSSRGGQAATTPRNKQRKQKGVDGTPAVGESWGVRRPSLVLHRELESTNPSSASPAGYLSCATVEFHMSVYSPQDETASNTLHDSTDSTPSSATRLQLKKHCRQFALLFASTLRDTALAYNPALLLGPGASACPAIEGLYGISHAAGVLESTVHRQISVCVKQWTLTALTHTLEQLCVQMCLPRNHTGSTSGSSDAAAAVVVVEVSVFVQELLAAVSKRGSPAGNQMRMLEIDTAAAKRQEGGIGEDKTGGDTLQNLLRSAALELQLAGSLLEAASLRASSLDNNTEPSHAAAAAAKATLLQSVAYELLEKVATQEFCLFVTSHGGSSGDAVVTLRGVSGLLQYAVVPQNLYCSPAEKWHARRRRQEISQGAALLLAVYMGLLPHVIRANASTDRSSGEGGDDVSVSPVLRILEGLKGCWASQEKMVRDGGPGGAAIWWLQTSASMLEGYVAAVRRRLALAATVADGAAAAAAASPEVSGIIEFSLDNISEGQDAEAARKEVELLDAALDKLSAMLSSLLYYDRGAYERHRANMALAADTRVSTTTNPATASSMASTIRGGIRPEEGGVSADEDEGELEPRRRTGKRSLFVTPNSTTDVLLSGPPSSTAGGGGGRGTYSRFTSRAVLHHQSSSSNNTNEGGGVSLLPSSFSAVVTGGGDGGSPNSKANTPTPAEGFSALFYVFVLQRDSVQVLLRNYGLNAKFQESIVEETWLRLVLAAGALRRALYSPPVSLHQQQQQQQHKDDITTTGNTTAGVGERLHHNLEADKGGGVVSTGTGEETSTAEVNSSSNGGLRVAALPAELHSLFLADSATLNDAQKAPIQRHGKNGGVSIQAKKSVTTSTASTASTTESRWCAVLRVLTTLQHQFPLQHFESLLFLTDSLTPVLLAIYDDGIALQARGGVNGGSYMNRRTAARMTSEVAERCASMRCILATGAGELLVNSTSLRDSIVSVQHARSLALLPSYSTAESSASATENRKKVRSALASSSWSLVSEAEAVVHGAFCAEAAIAVSVGFAEMPQGSLLWDSTAKALAVLRASSSSSSSNFLTFASSLKDTIKEERGLHVTLLAKQVTAAAVASNLAAINSICRRCDEDKYIRDGSSGRSTVVAAGTECYTRIMCELEADPQLLLLCSYSSFLETLVEARMRLHLDRDAASAFAHNVVLPLVLPIVVACLRKSSVEDTAATHEDVCSQTLLLLSSLSHLSSHLGKDVSDAARNAWCDVLLQVSVYCMRHARLEGHKKVRWSAQGGGGAGEGLPNVEWTALHTRACAGLEHLFCAGQETVAASGSTISGRGLNLLHFLDQSNSLVRGARVGSVYKSQTDKYVAALREYHEAIIRGGQGRVSFTALSRMEQQQQQQRHGALSDRSQHHGEYAELVSEVAARHRVAQAWYACVAAAQLAGGRLLPFLAGGRYRNAVALAPLVRYMEHYMREQTRRAQRLSIYKDTATITTCGSVATHASASVGVSLQKELAEGARGRRRMEKGTLDTGEVTKALSALEGSPLVLLDFVGHLGSASSWLMVCYAMNTAETALEVQHRRSTAAHEEVKKTAATAILSQLAMVPPPMSIRFGIPPLLPITLLKCIVLFSDALASSRATLLGFRGRSKVFGILAHPDSAEYRVIVLAIKQVVVYLDGVSYSYRVTLKEESKAAAAAGSTPPPFPSPSPPHTPKRGSFYTDAAPEHVTSTTSSVNPSSSSPIAGTSVRTTIPGDFCYFLWCSVGAMDLILETVKHHVLQQRTLRGDMALVTSACFGSQCTMLSECIRGFLQQSLEARVTRFRVEGGALLWVGLSTVALIGSVAHLDHDGGFFIGRPRQHVADVCAAVESLLDSLERTTDAAPVAAAMIAGVQALISHGNLSRRLSFSIGVLQREYCDLNSTLVELCALTSPCVSYPPAASVLHRVWTLVQRELTASAAALQAKAVIEHRDEDQAKKRKKHHHHHHHVQHSEAVCAALRVPSLGALRQTLEAFAELDGVNEGRTSHLTTTTTTADKSQEQSGQVNVVPRQHVLRWACDVPALLAGVVEDPSVQVRIVAADRRKAGKDIEDSDGATANIAGAGDEDEEELALLGLTADVTSATCVAATADFSFKQTVAEDGGDGGSMTLTEAIDMVLVQSAHVGRAVGSYVSKNSGASFATASSLFTMLSCLVVNVTDMLTHCSLQQILSRPGAGELFRNLGSLVDAHFMEELMNMQVLSTTAGEDGGGRSDDDTVTARRSARVLSQEAKAMWVLLGDKWESELQKPLEAQFLSLQKSLLLHVRRQRLLAWDGVAGVRVGSGTYRAKGATMDRNHPGIDMFSSSSSNERDPTATVVSRACAEALRGRCGEDYGDLPWHDDIRDELQQKSWSSERGGEGEQEQDDTSVLVLSHATLPTEVPLEVIMSFLKLLSRASASAPEMARLGLLVSTYAARHFVLLRPRLAGTAVNVSTLLHQAHDHHQQQHEALSGNAGDAHATWTGRTPHEVKSDWEDSLRNQRLPLTSAHAKEVAGLFFSHQDQQHEELSAIFTGTTAIARRPSSSSSSISSHETPSVEELTFEYIRDCAVYLHLLANIASVLAHFQHCGDLPAVEKMTSQALRAMRHSGRSNGGSSSGTGETKANLRDGSGRRGDMGTSTIQSLDDLQEMHMTRQTTQHQVNNNLLESIMLHYLNVSTNLTRHTDTITHSAADRLIAEGDNQTSRGHSDSNHLSGATANTGNIARACVVFADELRNIAATTHQETLLLILRRSEHSHVQVVRRVVHAMMSASTVLTPPLLFGSQFSDASSFPQFLSGAGKQQQQRQRSRAHSLSGPLEDRLQACRTRRPDLLCTSPTMLAIMTPVYFSGTAWYYMQNAPSQAVALVADCLAFHIDLTSPCVESSAPLSPLLAAVTELLSSTSVRNTRQQMVCERLMRDLTAREDFRQALAAPAVTLRSQGAAGSVPSEVIIPFLAAIARWDVHIGKQTIADTLNYVMQARPNVFGQPPVMTRQSKRSLVQVTSGGGSLKLHGCSGAGAKQNQQQYGAESGQSGILSIDEDMSVLDAFTAVQTQFDASADTHQHALASLNLSLSAAATTAMHILAMRGLSPEEASNAHAMLRAADDARRERARMHTAAAAAVVGASGSTAGGQAKLDLALRLEEPRDYGVAILHLRYALNKIVHISCRRLALQQNAAQLGGIAEILEGLASAKSKAGGKAQLHHQDPIVVGTMRHVLARALVCAQALGYSSIGAPLRYTSCEEDTQEKPMLVLPPRSPSSCSSNNNSRSSRIKKTEGEVDAGLLRLEEDAAVVMANTSQVHPLMTTRKVRSAIREINTQRLRLERRRDASAVQKRRRKRWKQQLMSARKVR